MVQVSLKKPQKVDLSKAPCEVLREYTPEHIAEEPAPPKQRVYTPKHEREEIIPDEQDEIISEPTNKVIFVAKASKPLDPVPVPTETEEYKKYSPLEITIIVISIVVIVGAVFLVGWFICQTPVQPTSYTVGSEMVDLISELFDYISGNAFFMLMVGVILLSTGFSIIRNIIDKV